MLRKSIKRILDNTLGKARQEYANEFLDGEQVSMGKELWDTPLELLEPSLYKDLRILAEEFGLDDECF